VRGSDALAFRVSADHGINQNRCSRTITKSKFSEQTNNQNKISRKKAESGGYQEIFLDLSWFWWMKSNASGTAMRTSPTVWIFYSSYSR
jgi:hypothetical protein